MKRSRILIVSGAALSRNPRVLKEASALSAAGHDVTVLTLRNHAEAEIFDREIMARAGFRRIVLDVAPVPGTSATGVLLRRLRAAASRRATRLLGRESMETIGPAGELLALARQQKTDLVIGHTEIGIWIAARLLAEGRLVGADFEDWHSEDLPPGDRTGRPVNILRETEQSLLRGAAFVLSTSEAMARELQSASGGQKPSVVHNSFALQPNPHVVATGEPPSFIWFSQTLGPARGLEEFLAAWSRTSRPARVTLLGEDRHDFRGTLLQGLPASHRSLLSFHDLVSPDELPTVIARHDIGLALEQPLSRNRDLTITNKILQYLNAGLAVVASPTVGQREVLAHGAQAGIFLGSDPAANSHLLDELLIDPARLRIRQQAARQLAETRYSWEHDRQTLLNVVHRALIK